MRQQIPTKILLRQLQNIPLEEELEIPTIINEVQIYHPPISVQERGHL